MLFLAFLKTLEPPIALLTLVLLGVYVLDTRRIRKASIRQAESLYQPCLVLEHQLREPMDQIVDSVQGPACSTAVADKLVVHNIGSGPASEILWTFRGLDAPMTFSVPYLLAGQRLELPLGRNTVVRGALVFAVHYKSIAGVGFISSQPLSEGQLGVLSIRRSAGA